MAQCPVTIDAQCPVTMDAVTTAIYSMHYAYSPVLYSAIPDNSYLTCVKIQALFQIHPMRS